jgi:hypothetical protein
VGDRHARPGPYARARSLEAQYSEDAIFIPLAIAVTIGWTTVGAMVASRTPGNPTGWLMIAVGVSFVIGGVGSEYATYALQTSPEVLPLASFAAWLSEWINVVLVAAVPLLLKGTQTAYRRLDQRVRTIEPHSRGRFRSCSSLSRACVSVDRWLFQEDGHRSRGGSPSPPIEGS